MIANGAPAPASAPASSPAIADSCSEALCKKLAKIGLHSEADLLVHLPLRYEDETRMTPVARAPWGEPVQVEVVVQSCEIQFHPRRQMVVRAADESGELTLRFFSFYPSQQAASQRRGADPRLWRSAQVVSSVPRWCTRAFARSATMSAAGRK
jgi:RecG-like helicase